MTPLHCYAGGVLQVTLARLSSSAPAPEPEPEAEEVRQVGPAWNLYRTGAQNYTWPFAAFAELVDNSWFWGECHVALPASPACHVARSPCAPRAHALLPCSSSG